MKPIVTACILSLALTGCVPAYTLKKSGSTSVAGDSVVVQSSTAWNGVPKTALRTQWEEVWTHNGPLLESVSFIGGLPEGKTLLIQKKKAAQKVPLFRADMSPDDLVSMLEASYRIRGVTVFTVQSVDLIQFLDGPGIRVRFDYAPGDGVSSKGESVFRVIDKKLYLMRLDGVSIHYFDAALSEFEQLVGSARLAKQ